MGSRTPVPRLPGDAVDPFPFYEQRRRYGDVFWDESAQAWLILGYHQAKRVLGGSGWTVTPPTETSAAVQDSIDAEFFEHSMLITDGPAHQRLCRAAQDVFTPSFIAKLSPGVDAIAGATIDSARPVRCSTS